MASTTAFRMLIMAAMMLGCLFGIMRTEATTFSPPSEHYGGAGFWNDLFDELPRHLAGDFQWDMCPMDATSLLTVPIWESRCSVLLVSKARDNRTDSGFIPLAVTKISPKGIVEYGPDWKGFLFHHFGGPGASAIKELWKNARSIRALAEGYSLIAVDNRGVILSGPNTNCFEDLWEVYYARSKPEHGNRTLDLSDEEMLKMELLLAEEANLRCYRKLGGLDGSLRYIGTEDVARDTISVFQALANFNERQKLPIPKVLHLFGESYGGRSALTTLALFPEWIGKVLIDSTTSFLAPWNYTDYILSSAAEIEPSLEYLSQQCWKTEGCRERMNKVGFGSLGRNGLVALLQYTSNLFRRGAIDNGLEGDKKLITTHIQFLRGVRSALFSPFADFQNLITDMIAIVVSERLPERLSSDIKATKSKVEANGDDNKATPESRPITLPVEGFDTDANLLISCTDIVEIEAKFTMDGLKRLYQQLFEVGGEFAAEPLIEKWVRCNGFKDSDCAGQPTLGSDKDLLGPFASLYPVLFIGNELDPITPTIFMDDARRLFPNSVYVKQIGVGHSALVNANHCLKQIVMDYLNDATVPSHNGFCYPRFQPFTQELIKDNTFMRQKPMDDAEPSFYDNREL